MPPPANQTCVHSNHSIRFIELVQFLARCLVYQHPLEKELKLFGDMDPFVDPQSRQIARLFLQSSELGPHTPSPQAIVSPPLCFREGRWTGQVGVGRRSQFRRGDRHCGTLGISVLCASAPCHQCTRINKIYCTCKAYKSFRDHTIQDCRILKF